MQHPHQVTRWLCTETLAACCCHLQHSNVLPTSGYESAASHAHWLFTHMQKLPRTQACAYTCTCIHMCAVSALRVKPWLLSLVCSKSFLLSGSHTHTHARTYARGHFPLHHSFSVLIHFSLFSGIHAHLSAIIVFHRRSWPLRNMYRLHKWILPPLHKEQASCPPCHEWNSRPEPLHRSRAAAPAPGMPS